MKCKHKNSFLVMGTGKMISICPDCGAGCYELKRNNEEIDAFFKKEHKCNTFYQHECGLFICIECNRTQKYLCNADDKLITKEEYLLSKRLKG